ncbi:MAG: TetR/AcrR family transcriptional regulator [Dorea sp.]
MEKKSVRSRIVSAAWQLFYENGYSKTTVDDIIALSGTSKGSFYYYFNTKDELLNSLSDILDEYYEELEEKMDPHMNNYDKLLYINVMTHSMMEEKINIELLASLYSTQLVTVGDNSLLNKNRKYYQLITKIVEEGQQKGEISKEFTVSAITKYYSMCERALVSDWCMSKGSYSLGEYSKECMPMMMEHFRVK